MSKRWVRLTYLAVVAGVFIWLLWRERDEIGELLRSARPAWLAAALVMSFGMIVASAGFWSAVISSAGPRLSLGESTRAAAQSLPARYLPGSVWYAAGRVGVLATGGYGTALLTAAAGMEMILSLAVAALIGLPLLLATGDSPGWALAWVLVAVVVIASLQPLGNRLLGWWERRRSSGAVSIPRRGYVAGLCWMVAFWVWSATTFWVFLQGFPAGDFGDGFLRVVGAYMVAWSIGFVTPFAPQGIGVTEAVLAGLLGSGDPLGIVAIVAGYRVMILIRDTAASLIGGGWRGARSATPPRSPGKG